MRVLVDEHEVRAVADLRTEVEVRSEGPGPMTREPRVVLRNLSLFPEAGHNTDAAAVEDGGPVVLPWQGVDRQPVGDDAPTGAAGFYVRYLLDRPDSVIETLRLIAHTDGAALVHCAAGKDRTGVVVAIALAEIGVQRDAIIDDYAMSAERIEAIFRRLQASQTYAEDLSDQEIDKHRPRDTTMVELLDCDRSHARRRTGLAAQARLDRRRRGRPAQAHARLTPRQTPVAPVSYQALRLHLQL